jgi:hypothetical protein
MMASTDESTRRQNPEKQHNYFRLVSRILINAEISFIIRTLIKQTEFDIISQLIPRS